LLFKWKSKKQKKRNLEVALPSAMTIALGKENLKIKIKNALPSALAMALSKEN